MQRKILPITPLITIIILSAALGYMIYKSNQQSKNLQPEPPPPQPRPISTDAKEYQKVETWQLASQTENYDGKKIELVDYFDGKSPGRFYPPEFSVGIFLLNSPYQPGNFNNRLAPFAEGIVKVRVKGEFHIYYSPPDFRIKDYIISVDSVEVISEKEEYQPVTLQELEQNREKYNRIKVEYSGSYKAGFEKSLIDKKIWLEFNPNAIIKGDFPYYGERVGVKVRGVMYASPGFLYGHLGSGQYLIRADEVEVLEIFE